MTRTEQLEQRTRTAEQRLATLRKRLAQEQARTKHAAQKVLAKRYYHVGTLADQAGLLVLSDTTLAALFAHLGTLVAAPDPVALLDALLHDAGASRACPGLAAPVLADGVAAVRQE
jgi:hypothetical protein